MKIQYVSKEHKLINIKVDNDTNLLEPDEILELNNNENSCVIQIFNYKKKAKMSVKDIFLVFLERLFLNIFNIIIGNSPEDWIESLDPFTIEATYKVEEQSNVLQYIPAKVSKKSMTIDRPKLLINNIIIDAKIDFDINHIERACTRYWINMVVLGIYALLPIGLVIGFSGKMMELMFIPVLIVGGIVWKIRKIFGEKQKIIEHIEKLL